MNFCSHLRALRRDASHFRLASATVALSACLIPPPPAFALQAIALTDRISLDGRLDEADWQRAPVSSNFIENMPREKQPARDRTEVRMLFDHDALYVGVRGFDAAPASIHAPFVRRDKVFGNQDNFIVWIDPTGARKFAQFFRVNPRGVLADGVWNEDNGEEDFSPDFDFEAVPASLPDGWSAEFRIPWASLRLPHPAPEKLSFIVFRNQPRDTRIRTTNVPLGRDPSCFLCVAEELTGLADLPRTSGLTLVPYVAANSSRTREGGPSEREHKFSAGADIKWRPSSEWVLDATFRPDFSQLELDAPQLKGNTRFALSLAEKRPFFLEGTDLYSTPLGLIYTRSITDPLWGARATYRSEKLDATVLTVRDRGGGWVILPSTYYSDARDQGASQATIARVRAPYAAWDGSGSVGALLSDRSYEDGSSNRTASVDALFKPGNESRLRAQFVGSETDDRVLRAKSSGHAAYVDGLYDDGVRHLWLAASSISPGFRSDNALITQTGYQSLKTELWHCIKYDAFFDNVCPGLFAGEIHAWNGASAGRWVTPALFANGARNSEWMLQPRWVNYARVDAAGQWHHTPTLYARAEGNPGERLAYAYIEAEVGRGVDVAVDQPARLASASLVLNTRPHPRAELEWKWNEFRLNDVNTQRWRLQERALQLVGIGYITAQDTLRLIAQHTRSLRNAAMYTTAVQPRTQSSALSLVFSHKRGLGREFNLGITHSRTQASGQPDRVTSEVFAKFSWAFSL
ncbi:MAG: carbohydrate binding family 9 domain-containing protein [Burkholderiales bacterium]|nr:carbohydrate binding family 9 domain-containing protein [Burkholderiales bacterium]